MSSNGMMLMMFISMFIIQYVFMSYVMTNSVENITNSIGKIYMSTIMGLFMVVAGVLMQHKFNIKQIILFVGLLIGCIYLYKIQFGISDKEYLKEMIEHHSMALLTSKAITEKSKDNDVLKLAQRIIQTQEKEINEMRNLINRPDKV